jgi:5-(carboxyamino)imidazole ribonucleotide mutase
MGSHSDWTVMENCAKQLKDLGVPFEAKVISAHRTPELLQRWVSSSTENGMEVIIAAAGGAAHLAGVTAAMRRNHLRLKRHPKILELLRAILHHGPV